jgi:hypothetical protein
MLARHARAGQAAFASHPAILIADDHSGVRAVRRSPPGPARQAGDGLRAPGGAAGHPAAMAPVPRRVIADRWESFSPCWRRRPYSSKADRLIGDLLDAAGSGRARRCPSSEPTATLPRSRAPCSRSWPRSTAIVSCSTRPTRCGESGMARRSRHTGAGNRSRRPGHRPHAGQGSGGGAWRYGVGDELRRERHHVHAEAAAVASRHLRLHTDACTLMP